MTKSDKMDFSGEGGDLLDGIAIRKHISSNILVMFDKFFGELFFFNLGNGLVAVNLTAFKKIHSELLLRATVRY